MLMQRPISNRVRLYTVVRLSTVYCESRNNNFLGHNFPEGRAEHKNPRRDRQDVVNALYCRQ